MFVVDIRRRTGYLFLAVIVGHVILVSTQVTTKSGVQTRWQNYFALQQVRQENERLKQQLGDLQVRLQEERGLAEQSQSLQKLLDLKTNTQLSTTGATVIAGGASPEFRTITIDKGTGEGLRANMAIIAPAGVV